MSSGKWTSVWSRILCCTFLAGASVSLAAPASALTDCTSPVLASQLACKLDTISWVSVEMSGTADKIAPKKEELERLVRLRLRTDLPLMTHERLPFQEALKRSRTTPGEEANAFLARRGEFRCLVWTVGDDYPVAFFVECALDGYGSYEQDDRQFSTRALGFTPREKVRSALDETLRNAVAAVAAEFMEARDKVNTERVPGG